MDGSSLESGSKIGQVRVTRFSLPLSAPYKLAFGDVAAFDTLIAEVSIEGGVGYGEATILSGYTPETIDQAWQTAKELAGSINDCKPVAAIRTLRHASEQVPFTAAMFDTAIEMASGHAALQNNTVTLVPLLFGLNSTDPEGIERELESAFSSGYGTVKVKVGFEVESDLQRIRYIQEKNNERMSLRIDGNQGYSLADAARFASEINPASVELLEQPCHMDDWAAHAEVIKVSNVPIMLDESIYGIDDIDRAADIGARFVKLKLMKMGSLDRLREGLNRIRKLGMEPVLGNGVASDIGCWMEICIARDLISNAGEMNGFLRQREPIVINPLRMERGAVEVPAGYWPELDRHKIESLTVEDFESGR